MSGLRLDSRASILSGGTRGPAAVPGKASDSLLYLAVAREGKLHHATRSNGPGAGAGAHSPRVDRCRPAVHRSSREPAQPAWWSFAKPVRGSVLSIDERIRSQSPRRRSPHADPPRHVRSHRTAADPNEVDAFVNDPDPKAYEKLIDRLLASPRYGERWGRLWLDVVRYADTGGYETDVLFPERLALSRLRHSLLQRGQAVRRFRPGADRRRRNLARQSRPRRQLRAARSQTQEPGAAHRHGALHAGRDARGSTRSSAISTAPSGRPSASTSPARRSSASRCNARAATITSSIPSRSAITTGSRPSSRAAKTAKCPSSARCASTNSRATRPRSGRWRS